MNDLNKNVRLYNLIFPIWLIWIFPLVWLVVLPANFIIDLIVILITLKLMKVSGIKIIARKSIIKIWLFGFLSDFIGSAFLLLATLIDFNSQTDLGRWWYDNIYYGVSYNPYVHPLAVIIILCGLIITGICIYFFNVKYSFKHTTLSLDQKKKLSLTLAIVTTPYVFLIPTAWFY